MRPSIILRTTTLLLVPLLLVTSVAILWRGHNEPGGGFIGGLLAAASLLLVGMAYGVEKASASMRIHPRQLIGWGLALALGSTLIGPLFGEVLMKGMWLHFGEKGQPGSLSLGTPLLFDIGVYLVVLGSTLMTILAVKGEDDTPEAG